MTAVSLGILLFLVALVIAVVAGFYLSGHFFTRARKVDHPEIPDFHMEMAPEFPLVETRTFEQPARPGGYELPWSYGDTRLVALVRDPYWIHFYWEISQQTREQLAAHYGEEFFHHTLPVLRVYDITGTNNPDQAVNTFDVLINEQARNWYLRVPEVNHTYVADLGRKFPNGQFIAIVRSNIVSTPRDGLSDKIDPEWMLVSEKEKILYGRIQGTYGLSSPELFKVKGKG